MVALRSRRLDALLGVRIDDVEARHLQALVTQRVPETFDLEYKAELYGSSESDKRSLATDVAALANTDGGLLVLGVVEDDQARAAQASGVSIAESECRRIFQVIGSQVVPLPVFDVLPVEDPATPGDGFLLVAVARSPLGPHAVLVNEGLRYPRRNGAVIRCLSEPEVATAYRQRFAEAHRQIDRAHEIEQQILSRLPTKDNRCWVIVSLVPDLPGELLINQATLRQVQQELRNQRPMVLPTSLAWTQVAVGRRCLMVGDAMNNSLAASWLAADLHGDGAGVFAVNASDLVRAARLGIAPDAAGDRWLHDEQVVNGILSGLRFLSLHARERAAAGGNGLVRVLLHPVDEGAVCLGIGDRNLMGLFNQAVARLPLEPAQCAAPLDSLTVDGPDLVATAYLLASELCQAFGQADVLQLTRGGQLRLPYWSQSWQQQVSAWAEAAGVTVSNETLP